MIRLLVSNQRGGVGKTTTAINFARYLADQGKRVLLIDIDPQGSVEQVLGLRAHHHLAHFIAHRFALSECIEKYTPEIHVLCSSRDTLQAEAALMGAQARELVLHHLLKSEEHNYDAVLIDSAPSISILQSCAMFYTQNVLVPTDMDSLSVTGAMATITAASQLNDFLRTEVRIVGILPTQVDRRLQMAQSTLATLETIRERFDIPVLPEIRIDTTVGKAIRARKLLADYDASSRAFKDYQAAFGRLVEVMNGQTAAQA
jgi:chromosome partitioning protein